MNPKPRPNHQQYLAALRAMTPEQRLLKAFELSEFSRQLFKAGLRDRFPDKTEAELHNLVVSKAIQKSAIKLQLQTQWQQLVDQAEPY